MNLNLDGERDTEREGRREMEEEKEWKFPKVKLTMIPRIKDNGVYYCRKGKKKYSFTGVGAILHYDTRLGEQSIACFQL